MNPRDRRALVLGGAIVAALALTLRGIPAAEGRLAELHRIALERQATLTRAQAVLESRLAVRDSFEHVVAGIISLAPHLLDGRTAADANASLSGLLALAARRHAVRVLRTETIEFSDGGTSAFGRATVHVEVEGDINGILRLVRALETADPLLTISSLEISAPSAPAAAGQAEVLHGEVTITGYYLASSSR